jgi:hypothetical protein
MRSSHDCAVRGLLGPEIRPKRARVAAASRRSLLRREAKVRGRSSIRASGLTGGCLRCDRRSRRPAVTRKVAVVAVAAEDDV